MGLVTKEGNKCYRAQSGHYYFVGHKGGTFTLQKHKVGNNHSVLDTNGVLLAREGRKQALIFCGGHNGGILVDHYNCVGALRGE